ncbi:MAG: type II toxin-antitoxin system VapC family toxin [Nitrososphaerota archaeon]|nr:type II toxin-antitoxin system VapC family toxin [Nitrososphaerota archaeon]
MKAIVDASSLLMMMKNFDEETLLYKLNDLATLDLAFYEIGNALWKHVSIRNIVGKEEIESVISAVRKVFLSDNFTKISWRDLDCFTIFDMAVSNKITFYDASYLVTSITFKMPLVTEDEPLKKAAVKHVQVMSWRKL